MSTTERNPRLLHVDDEEIIRRAFERSFGKRYQITGAGSGAAALAALDAQAFDVAVIDFQMAEMKGSELIRRIAADHPEVPMIMLTAYAHLREVVELAETKLVVAVVMKPWEDADMEHAVATALGRAGRRTVGP